MKFPFPIKCHSGLAPRITQQYGDPANAQYYKDHGINIPFHNGLDVALGNSQQTYGTELICTFPKATVTKVTFDTPVSTKGNGITIQSEPYVDDDMIVKKLVVLYWHTSADVATSLEEISYGDTIARIGNSGLVEPAPTADSPFNGSHLHLGVHEYRNVNGNFVLYQADNGVGGCQNPLNYFDITDLIQGEAPDITSDVPAVMWGIRILGLKDWVARVKYFISKLNIKL